jgi:PAS domain S-box-containing protein
MNNPLGALPVESSSPHPWPNASRLRPGPQALRILHLEDNDLDAALVRKLVTVEWPASQITLVSTRFAFTGELQLRQFDLILSDYTLESFNGLEALALAQQRTPETPFILLSGTVSEERAIEAVRAGARDYVLKAHMGRLTTAMHRALKENEERDRRQQAERYSRELVGFLNKARDAIIVINLDDQITFWNRGAELLSGWSAVEVANQTTERLFGPDVARQIARGLKVTTEQGEWSGELELRTKGGQTRLVDFRISLINDDRGRAQARLAICTDLTKQRQAERRIREQTEMLDQAREAIVITDMDGRVIYWSAGAERIYGWQGDEAVGQTFGQLFPGVSDLGRVQHMRDITRAQGEWHGQMHLHDRLGKPRTVDIRRTLIRDESGRGKAHLSISSDVTEQKRLEEQLVRVQRLENIGLLAAGIAHDLNNMLAPMLIAAPMLRQVVTDPAALRTLTILENSAERGSALIRQILAFAQNTGSGTQLVQPAQVLRDISLFVAETFPKNIKVQEQVAADLWPVKGNPAQLHQVLLNLCLNARDAMTSGGTLFLRAENRVLDDAAAAAIDGGRPGSFVTLQVEDTGTGIAPEVLARLWEPFVTTKGAGKGTGLGLSTVRGVLNQHGAFVQLETVPGKGTSFRIFLPPAILHAAPNPAAAAGTQGHGELILIVDDEPPVRDLISRMLTRQGYRVLVASDGAEAAAFFAKHASEIKLVISDLNMPNLDGAMLAKVLKRMNPDVRILIVSGLDAPGTSRSPFRPEEFKGAFLRKPFKSDDLLRKTAELLRSPLPVAN